MILAGVGMADWVRYQRRKLVLVGKGVAELYGWGAKRVLIWGISVVAALISAALSGDVSSIHAALKLETMKAAAFGFALPPALAFLIFWTKASFDLQRDADAEIAALSATVQTKVNGRADVEAMLRLFEPMLTDGDALALRARNEGGNPDRYFAGWLSSYEPWSARLIMALRESHPLDAFKLERALLSVGYSNQEWTKRAHIQSKEWNRKLDRFEPQHRALESIVTDLRGQLARH